MVIQRQKVEPTSEIEVTMSRSKAESGPISEGSKDSVTSNLSDMIEDSEDSAILSTSATEARKSTKTVFFTTLQIREYPIIPGDNPSVLFGCPLSIAWEYDCEVACSVEDYEETRPEPRTMTELRMPSSLRQDKLLRVGFSRRAIQEATKQATVVRMRRRRTEETMNLAPVQYFFERARRKLMGGGTKRKERELLMRSSSEGSITGKPVLRRDYSLRDSMETLPLDASMSSLRTN